MELDLVSEAYQELRRFINTVDRPDAAESLVSILVENGVPATDIKNSFGNDADIRNALAVYMDDDVYQFDEDDEDNDEDDDELD